VSDYDDIINLPYKKSMRHTPMDRADRAAQFAAFAALNGYDDAISETGRLTLAQAELTDHELSDMDARLKEILVKDAEIEFICFVPDASKTGGAYKSVKGKVSRIDEVRKVVILEGGEQVPLEYIRDFTDVT